MFTFVLNCFAGMNLCIILFANVGDEYDVQLPIAMAIT